MTTVVKNHLNKEYQFSISFDNFGNLYFEHPSIQDVYQINVDGRNKPYSIKDKFEVIDESSSKIGKFKILGKRFSLKEKIKKELETNKITFDEFDLNDDDLDQEEDYFPEDNDHINIIENDTSEEDLIYHEVYDEENVKKYGIDNLEFLFWGDTSEIKVKNRIDGDISALYDTYIYGEGGKLLFKTNSKDDSAIFRFNIHTNGKIFFRPIGEIETLYHLQITEDQELIFVN